MQGKPLALKGQNLTIALEFRHSSNGAIWQGGSLANLTVLVVSENGTGVVAPVVQLSPPPIYQLPANLNHDINRLDARLRAALREQYHRAEAFRQRQFVPTRSIDVSFRNGLFGRQANVRIRQN